jgi:hypothetical protein
MNDEYFTFYKHNQKLNLQIANQQRSATDPIIVLVHNRINVKKKLWL